MDLFDERVLAVLNDGKPRFFAQLLGEVGFGRNTLKLRLKRLTAQSLVAKEKTVSNGRGRPKFTYYISPRARPQVSAALSDPSITIAPFQVWPYEYSKAKLPWFAFFWILFERFTNSAKFLKVLKQMIVFEAIKLPNPHG